jgi:serine/threonine protein kinase
MSIELFDIENYSLIKFKKFKIVEKKKIGVGGFSKVFSGYYKSLPLAVKKFKNFDLKEFTKEIRIIKKFKHPRVPHLYGVCKEEKTEKLSLISELVTGETLDSYLKKNSCKELEILVHLIELTKILEFFHSNKVIHRDLKPSNIMIDHNMNLRLLDFGISKITSNSLTTTIAMGTLLYMAPENFQISETASSSDLTATSVINSKVDVWALGCIIDEIFSGQKPWSSIAKENARIIGHLFSKSNFPINRDIIKRNSIIELIESCTIIEPSKRIDIKQAKLNLMKILFNDVIKGMSKSKSYLDDYFAHYNAKKRIIII